MRSPRSGRTVSNDPIHMGLWLIPVAGILGFLIFSYWMTTPDGADDPQGFADWAAGSAGMGSGIIYILAVIALLLGMMALSVWLAGGAKRDLALVGLVCTVVSIGFLLAALGTMIFGAAVVADEFNAGNVGIEPALEDLSGGNLATPVLVAYAIAVVAALVAGIVLGIAIWQSATLPRWSGVLIGLGFVLFATTAPVSTHVGGILLAAGSIWIARTIQERTRGLQEAPLGSRPASAG